MSDISTTISNGFGYYFQDFLDRVQVLAGDLSEQEFWSNPYPYGNSMGHLVLHITGNLNYYIGAQLAATLVVGDGSKDVAVRRLTADQFAVAGQYQEFAVPFTPSSSSNGLIVLTVTRNGRSDLDWDVTSLYTAPQPAVAPLNFVAPDGYYRSNGVQARLVAPDSGGAFGTLFSAPIEVHPHRQALAGGPFPATPVLQINPTALVFNTPTTGGGLLDAVVAVTCSTCSEDSTWVVESDAAWLSVTLVGGYLQVQVDPSALATGIHTATITISLVGEPDIPAIVLPVTVLIGHLNVLFPTQLYIPTVLRG